jgi:tetratricopeptide (TPR) repeat protein
MRLLWPEDFMQYIKNDKRDDFVEIFKAFDPNNSEEVQELVRSVCALANSNYGTTYIIVKEVTSSVDVELQTKQQQLSSFLEWIRILDDNEARSVLQTSRNLPKDSRRSDSKEQDDISAIVTPQQMRDVLEKSFNDTELRNLCFDMTIDYETLPGAGKADKARELIQYCTRHSCYKDLVQRCRKLRPEAFATVKEDCIRQRDRLQEEINRLQSRKHADSRGLIRSIRSIIQKDFYNPPITELSTEDFYGSLVLLMTIKPFEGKPFLLKDGTLWIKQPGIIREAEMEEIYGIVSNYSYHKGKYDAANNFFERFKDYLNDRNIDPIKIETLRHTVDAFMDNCNPDFDEGYFFLYELLQIQSPDRALDFLSKAIDINGKTKYREKRIDLAYQQGIKLSTNSDETPGVDPQRIAEELNEYLKMINEDITQLRRQGALPRDTLSSYDSSVKDLKDEIDKWQDRI